MSSNVQDRHLATIQRTRDQRKPSPTLANPLRFEIRETGAEQVERDEATEAFLSHSFNFEVFS